MSGNDIFTEGSRVPYTPRDLSIDAIDMRLARIFEQGRLIDPVTEAGKMRIQRGLGLLAASRSLMDGINV